jgi:hypothetical protein
VGLKAEIVVILGTLLLEAAIVLVVRHERKHRARELQDGLDGVFSRAFERELLVGDRADDIRALWKSVRDRAHRALASVGAASIPRLRRGERRKLEHAIEKEIPALRAESQG